MKCQYRSNEVGALALSRNASTHNIHVMSICKPASRHGTVPSMTTVMASRATRVRASRAKLTRQAADLHPQHIKLVRTQVRAAVQEALVRLVAGVGPVDVARVAEVLALLLHLLVERLLGELVGLGQLDVHALAFAVDGDEGLGLFLGGRDVDDRRFAVGRHPALADGYPVGRGLGGSRGRHGAGAGGGRRRRRCEGAGEARQLADARRPRRLDRGRRGPAVEARGRGGGVDGRGHPQRCLGEVLGPEDAREAGHSET